MRINNNNTKHENDGDYLFFFFFLHLLTYLLTYTLSSLSYIRYVCMYVQGRKRFSDARLLACLLLRTDGQTNQ